MSDPTRYIVEIDETGNTSIKYADGTPYSVNVPECGAEVSKQLAPKKIGEREFGPHLFLHENLNGGETDAAQGENVGLPAAD